MRAYHLERHRTKSIGWLRAAVLGANDGIVSTASLVLGVVEAFGAVYLAEVFDRDAIGFLFLILVLMIRPQGLLGRA